MFFSKIGLLSSVCYLSTNTLGAATPQHELFRRDLLTIDGTVGPDDLFGKFLVSWGDGPGGGQQTEAFFDLGASVNIAPMHRLMNGMTCELGYDPAKSTTVEPVAGAREHINIGQGVEGPVWKDTLNMNGIHTDRITLLANTNDTSCKACIGLSPLSTLMDVAGLSHKSASFYADPPTTTNDWANIHFAFGQDANGESLRSKYQGDIQYQDFRDLRHWRAAFRNVRAVKDPEQGENFYVVFDTGSEWIRGPPKFVDEYFKSVPSSTKQPNGAYHYPCSATLPDLRFRVSRDEDIVMPATVLQQEGRERRLGNGQCWTILLPQEDDGTHVWIWGMPFLQGVFTDMQWDGNGLNRIGFATRNGPVA